MPSEISHLLGLLGHISQVAIVESEDTKNWINMSLSRSSEGRKRKGFRRLPPLMRRTFGYSLWIKLSGLGVYKLYYDIYIYILYTI